MADRLWRGEASTRSHHPVVSTGDLCEVADSVAFVPTFANCTAVDTGDGLLLVDTASSFTADRLFEQVRGWRRGRLDTAVFSHGHIDHVFGVGPFEAEAAQAGWPAPRVVAHERVAHRFDRYRLTAGYNEVVNRRQFGIDSIVWPTQYRYPDEEYSETLSLRVGGIDVELRHEMGETDDATVTWLPGLKVLCPGDLFVWSSPNAGNPQKVQRYPREWATALRRMASLGATLLLPGHGLPIAGADRISQALTETAEYLESLVDQVLELMNAGARLAEVIETVTPPAHLVDRPFLQPVYDEPEFIVRNVWRLYGGWWDGNPAHLHPPGARTLAGELSDLVGGAARL
ncbi:MAG TPA: alkyl sulfatase dimerization domain-containing protein, partial [Acidimicrobiales bacterium]|nr:alkyl sulfatase dimerization domain-containing protein [Acidimicrobiales bacterium]